MLQQTQVKTVLQRFYFPFLEKFPTFRDVAHAPIDDVLKAWEGLGYYTRARNLHKTAQETKGKLPSTAEALEKLSGIGSSTAHAVACFAFFEPLPILDANVKRILYRFFAIKKGNTKELWKLAYELFDKENAYFYNQGMMDIGSMVCTHKNPNCEVCPFKSKCQGKNTPLLYPEKKAKKMKPTRKRFMIVYHYENKYFLSQNKTKLLAGLWAFPQVEEYDSNHPHTTHLGDIIQQYSHFKLDAKVLLVPSPIKHKKHFSIEDIENLALSTADKKALVLIKEFLK